MPGHGSTTKSQRLKALLQRDDRVLSVMHVPSVAIGRLMERAGCEAGFVGTSGVVGSYTGLADVGTASMTECIQIAGWIADGVDFPIILDGDTGHGGIMAVRRLVRECIRAGLAGVRIDDQPIEGKRKTQIDGIEVVPIEHAVARYRAAVDMRDELDPDFVIMAQCYARDADNGGFEACLERLQAYRERAGVDWVQMEAPHSVDEIRAARKAVPGPLSFMKGRLPAYLSPEEHLELGVNIAWYSSFMHQVIWAAAWDFSTKFWTEGFDAWRAFEAWAEKHPYPNPLIKENGEGFEKQQELEAKYFQPSSSR